jgi:hypothetical protein
LTVNTTDGVAEAADTLMKNNPPRLPQENVTELVAVRADRAKTSWRSFMASPQ